MSSCRKEKPRVLARGRAVCSGYRNRTEPNRGGPDSALQSPEPRDQPGPKAAFLVLTDSYSLRTALTSNASTGG